MNDEKRKIVYKIISSVISNSDELIYKNRTYKIDSQIYHQIKKSKINLLRLLFIIFIIFGGNYIGKVTGSLIILLIYSGILIILYHFIIHIHLVRKLPDNIFDYLKEKGR